MKTLRPTFRSANELRLAEPDAFNNTVTIKVKTQPKKAGAQTVFNANSSINVQRSVAFPLPVGCTDKCVNPDQERLALRFSISGSTKSRAEVLQMITDFKVNLAAVESDLVSGFLPPDSVVITVGNTTIGNTTIPEVQG